MAATACSSLRYGLQALAGGAGILARRESIARELRRHDLPAAERERLELATAIRDFSVRELALPDNRSYRSVVRLGRDTVAWNVVAAPELSVTPRTWCFPVAGCVSYRGYFHEADARRLAAGLAASGDDVAIVGVAAYSTLGWFADPIFESALDEEPWHLAGLVFHELAHQVAWAPGDTTFNESFATAVEELGVERWLDRGNSDEAEHSTTLAAAARAAEDERRFVGRLLAARAALEELYSGTADEAKKRSAKSATLEELGRTIDADLADGRLGARFAGYRGRRWNNADLAAVADYTLELPAFRRLYAASGSFPPFYAEVKRLAALPEIERRRELAALADSSAGSARDAAPTPRSPGRSPR